MRAPMGTANAEQTNFSHSEATVRRAPREVYAHLDRLPMQLLSEHLAWREATIELIETRDEFFPTTSRLPLTRIGALVDMLAVDLHRLTTMLSMAHGDPDLGNKEDPVDELVYIILSRRTRELLPGRLRTSEALVLELGEAR
jgi:hypothetical protein